MISNAVAMGVTPRRVHQRLGRRKLFGIVGTTAALASLLAPSQAAVAAEPVPPGMLPGGSYAISVSSIEPGQTSGPSLNVLDDATDYIQEFNLPPDNIDIALSSDALVPGAVDLDSVNIDGITFSQSPCGTVCVGNFYRPPDIEGIVSPATWSDSLYQNPDDPTNPQWNVLEIDYTANPPTLDLQADGTYVEVQEIDATMSFTPYRTMTGTISQVHLQVVGDPTRALDAYNGNVTTSEGTDHFSDIIVLGNIGDPINM